MVSLGLALWLLPNPERPFFYAVRETNGVLVAPGQNAATSEVRAASFEVTNKLPRGCSGIAVDPRSLRPARDQRCASNAAAISEQFRRR